MHKKRKRRFYSNVKSYMAMVISASMLFTSVDCISVRAEELSDMGLPVLEEEKQDSSGAGEITKEESVDGPVTIISFQELSEEDSCIKLTGEKKALDDVLGLMAETLTANVEFAGSVSENAPEDDTKPGESETEPGEEEQPGDSETEPGEEEQPSDGETEPGEEEQPSDGETEPGEEEQPGGETEPGEEEQPGDGETEPGEEEQPGDGETEPGEEEQPGGETEPGEEEQPGGSETEPGEEVQPGAGDSDSQDVPDSGNGGSENAGGG